MSYRRYLPDMDPCYPESVNLRAAIDRRLRTKILCGMQARGLVYWAFRQIVYPKRLTNLPRFLTLVQKFDDFFSQLPEYKGDCRRRVRRLRAVLEAELLLVETRSRSKKGGSRRLMTARRALREVSDLKIPDTWI